MGSIRRGVCSLSLLVALVLLLVSAVAVAQDDKGVTMVYMSDPQYVWYSPEDAAKSAAAIKRMVAASDNIQQLGRWPYSLRTGGGATIAKPSGVIINGDLTAYFHQWQFQFYRNNVVNRDGQNTAPYPLYPGLGNHDYKNNLGDCRSDYQYPPIDGNRCAKEAIWYMADAIQSLPGLVNHDVSGAITVKNMGAFVARFSISYDQGGSRQSQSTDVFEVLQSRTLIIPPGATNVEAHLEEHTGFNWKSVVKPTATRPWRGCYELTGTTLFPNAAAVSCSTRWPDGSNGSLAYSFDVGNYHFVQLQYRPDYAANLQNVDYVFFDSPGFSVTQSFGWLTADLAAATAAGKRIVINMHDPLARDCGTRCNPGNVITDPQFTAAIANTNVVAIFGGHLHELFGKAPATLDGVSTVINNGRYTIPTFTSGSADCERFLLADFHDRYFNVAAVDSYGSAPVFVTGANAQCRPGFPHANLSDTAPRTVYITRPPVLSAITATPSSLAEGGAVTFSAEATDADGDALTWSWNFNDGSTGSGRTVTHVYADNGSYTATVTVNDGYDGTASKDVIVTVANVNPTIAVTSAAINENDVATLDVTIADPGVPDTFTLTIDWKDGGAPETFTPAAGTTSYSHRYGDDDPTSTPSDLYTVAFSLRDDDGGTAATIAGVTVSNVQPVAAITSLVDEAGQLVGLDGPVLAGLSVTSHESYADTGLRDTRTATRDWGDGTPIEALGVVTATTSAVHVYAAARVYPLTVIVTDDDSGAGTASRDIRVVTPVQATTEAIAALATITSTNADAARSLEKALKGLNGNPGASNGALHKLAAGQYAAALKAIAGVIGDLEAAERADSSLDFTKLKSLLTLVAKSVAVAQIASAESTAATPGQVKRVADSKAFVAAGQARLAAREYIQAVELFHRSL